MLKARKTTWSGEDIESSGPVQPTQTLGDRIEAQYRRVSRIELLCSWFVAIVLVSTLLLFSSYVYEHATHYQSAMTGCRNWYMREFQASKEMLKGEGGVCNGDLAQTTACHRARRFVEADPNHEMYDCYKKDLRKHREEEHNDYYAVWLENVIYKHSRQVLFALSLVFLIWVWISSRQTRQAFQTARVFRASDQLPYAIYNNPKKEK